MRSPQRAHLVRWSNSGLLAVKLDDQLLVNRAVNVITDGQSRHPRAHLAVLRRSDPGGATTPRRRLPCAFDVRILAAGLPDADDIARFHLERGDVHLAPVDFDVTVIDELS